VARALYTPAPTAAEAAAWGLTLEEAAGEVTEIWPDNAQAVTVFAAMGTQWRFGMAGPTGLDYAALPEVWRRTHTAPAERDEVFDCLRIMEEAALQTMASR
jgi:hypothetical protein